VGGGYTALSVVHSTCLEISLVMVLQIGPKHVAGIIMWYNLIKYKVVSEFFDCFWRDSPQWAMSSSFTRFLDHTQRRTTVGRIPLDEWLVRRRDLYLTTHNTHRQTSMPAVGFEPTISAGESHGTTTHPKTRCRKPCAATQHLMLLMMGLCTGNMSS